jgi:hypothetical protein
MERIKRNEAEEKPAGAIIIVVAPDGTLITAGSYKELAEKAEAYRDYLR